MAIFMRSALRLTLILLLAWCSGCGSDEPEIVRVTGTVTRGGKPVPGLIVHFQPEGGRPSWGQTDAQGRFDLDYDPEHRGAKVGKHKVYFEMGSAGTSEPGGPVRAASADHREILSKYGSRDASPLTVEIKEEGQDVDLKVD
jgi:hypothetical protein